MKRFTILVLTTVCLGGIAKGEAQQRAVTETGAEVLLFDDGTWSYVDEDTGKDTEIPVNPEVFSKPDGATFLVKSTITNIGIYIDPERWSFGKAAQNPAAEYEFELKNGDLYANVITERISIPLLNLKDVILQNARSVAPDIEIVNVEYRIVNGLEVMHIQMEGTMFGTKLAFLGYYYSNSQGTTQFTAYTARSLLEDYKAAYEGLLNGIVEVND